MKKSNMQRRKCKRGNLVNYNPPASTRAYEAPVELDSERPKTIDTLVPKADIDFLKQSFRFYDKEKKGFIKDYELQIFYPTIGIHLEEEKVQEVLKRLGENENK
jgi:hypothetical protein